MLSGFVGTYPPAVEDLRMFCMEHKPRKSWDLERNEQGVRLPRFMEESAKI